MNNDLYTRYFMFSYEHYRNTIELEKKIGNMNYKFGKVIVSGNYKKYTFITRDPETYSSRYPDARIVTSGDIRKIKYTSGDV